MKIGILFPGQGTQHVGMGKFWYQQERVVQDCFDRASSCVDINLAKLCFSSHSDELKNTVNAQLGIFVVSSSLLKVLEEKLDLKASLVAGHSSGEYSAVHAINVLSFTDALYLLHRRALLMDQATRDFKGTMIAVLGLTPQEVRAICAAYDVPNSTKTVAQVAGYNGPQNTVVACSPSLVGRIERAVRAAGGRSREITVAGAFHSRLMDNAQTGLIPYLARVSFKDSSVPLVANATARPIVRASSIAGELGRQMCLPVLWWQSMKQFASCDTIIQVGPGRTYAKILQRHWPEKRIFSFNDLQDLEPIRKALQVWRPNTQTKAEPA